MEKSQTFTVIIVDDEALYTIDEVSHYLNISSALFNEMEELGLFQSTLNAASAPSITKRALHRIEAACRMHHDLEVNLPGVILALELLDELEELRRRLAILERN